MPSGEGPRDIPMDTYDPSDTMEVTPIWDRDVGIIRGACDCMTVSTFKRPLTRWELDYFGWRSPHCPIHGDGEE